MNVDPSGEGFWVAVAIGAVAGLLGQGITDAAISLDRGELYVSSWQSYVGATLGGAVGAATFVGTGSIAAGAFVTGFFTTGMTESLNMLFIENYDKRVGKVLLESVIDGSFSLLFSTIVPDIKIANNFVSKIGKEMFGGILLDLFYAAKTEFIENKPNAKKHFKRIPRESYPEEEEEYVYA